MIWFGCHSYFLILIHSYCLVQYTFIYLLIIPTQTTDWGHLLMWSFLADRTATQYDRLLGAACCPSVCLWRCAFWLSGSVYRAKSYTSMFLAGMFLFVPSDTFCRMYRLATKHILEKNGRKRRKCGYGLRLTHLSKRHDLFVNNDTLGTSRPLPWTWSYKLTQQAAGWRRADSSITPWPWIMQQRCADCGRVRLRTQIRSNCWIRGLTANGFFWRRCDRLVVLEWRLRTRTDTDHNFSAWILCASLIKLALRGGFRGGQCLITVQLPYNSACISIFIQRSRCCDTVNSVRILHAVRSAITAIAELLVVEFLNHHRHMVWRMWQN